MYDTNMCDFWIFSLGSDMCESDELIFKLLQRLDSYSRKDKG